MANLSKQLREKKCPICDKTFIFRDNWAYKKTYGDHVKAYCSWTCLRRAEKEKESVKSA